MNVGGIYLLKGSLVMRYHGPFDAAALGAMASDALYFQRPSVPLTATSYRGGYSASPAEVIREFKAGVDEDRAWLERRVGQMTSRASAPEVYEYKLVLKELGFA